MNQNQKNRDERLGKLLSFFSDQKDSMVMVPAIADVFADISSFHKEIGLNMKILQGGTKSKVASKDDSLSTVIRTGLVFAGAIYGCADKKNDVELLTFADVNSKSMSKKRQSEMPIFVERIIDKADELGSELEPFGVNEHKRIAARAVIDDYIQKFDILNNGKISKQSANATIILLLSKADKKIKVLARLMLGFKDTNPELFNKFEIANTIIDKGGNNGSSDTPPPTPPPAQ